MFRDVDGRCGGGGADGGRKRRRRSAAGSARPSGHLPSPATAPGGRLRAQPSPEHGRAGPRCRPAERRAAARRARLVPEQASERSTPRKTKSVAVVVERLRQDAGINIVLLTYLLPEMTFVHLCILFCHFFCHYFALSLRLSVVAPFRLPVLRSGTAYQMTSPPLCPLSTFRRHLKTYLFRCCYNTD